MTKKQLKAIKRRKKMQKQNNMYRNSDHGQLYDKRPPEFDALRERTRKQREKFE